MTPLSADFVRSLEALGSDYADARAWLDTTPDTSIRLNPAKHTSTLPATDDGHVPWDDNGIYLAERPRFTLDPALHQGAYYVQDASSMIVTHVLRQFAPLYDDIAAPVVLDACAAPGGKTLAALSVLPPSVIVVCNEFDTSRVMALEENLIRNGDPRTIVTNADASRFGAFNDTFDIIICDAPCSGEGMMRKDDEARRQWSESLVKECARRQRLIVTDLWRALRPGGLFIYSTCTFNRTENEDITAYMATELGAEPLAIPVEPDWGILPSRDSALPALRLRPGRVRGEGLFMAALRKPGTLTDHRRAGADTGRGHAARHCEPLRIASQWVDTQRLTPVRADDDVSLLPHGAESLIGQLRGKVKVRRAGAGTLTLKGRDLLPSHSLALSTALSPGAFASVELDRPAAIDYLCRTAPILPPDAPHGYVMLTYGGLPLGLCKNIGNRANSLLPQNMRILHR